MSKAQSLQDPFLNALRRERIPVSIYLVNGIKLQGTVESFDQFVVLLRNTVSQMVYKHAISLNLATSVRTTAIGKTADYVGGAAYATTAAIGQQGAGVDGTALSAGDITITVGSSQAVSVGAAVAGSSNGQTTSSASSPLPPERRR